jgi:Transglutaminase-like superfamily
VNPILLTALFLAADPGANSTTQSYVISLDDRDVGYAELSIERPATNPKKGTFKYTFSADLGVSGDPCLRSHEDTSGTGKATDAALPEELFIALAGELGNNCKTLKGAGPILRKDKGKGCWTEASFENATGTIFGVPVEVRFSPNLMPESVKYKTLGVAYRSVVEVPAELKECRRTVADDGVEAEGAKGLPARKLVHAVYDTKPSPTEVKVSTVALPPAVKETVADQRSEEMSSCQAAAETLAKALTEKGVQARAVAGLILDDGRYYPHAWVEAKIGKDWVALDSTTSDGAADAGRLKIGPLGELETGLNLLRLLHAPPKLTSSE